MYTIVRLFSPYYNLLKIHSRKSKHSRTQTNSHTHTRIHRTLVCADERRMNAFRIQSRADVYVCIAHMNVFVQHIHMRTHLHRPAYAKWVSRHWQYRKQQMKGIQSKHWSLLTPCTQWTRVVWIVQMFNVLCSRSQCRTSDLVMRGNGKSDFDVSWSKWFIKIFSISEKIKFNSYRQQHLHWCCHTCLMCVWVFDSRPFSNVASHRH